MPMDKGALPAIIPAASSSILDTPTPPPDETESVETPKPRTRAHPVNRAAHSKATTTNVRTAGKDTNVPIKAKAMRIQKTVNARYVYTP